MVPLRPVGPDNDPQNHPQNKGLKKQVEVKLIVSIIPKQGPIWTIRPIKSIMYSVYPFKNLVRDLGK